MVLDRKGCKGMELKVPVHMVHTIVFPTGTEVLKNINLDVQYGTM